MYYGETGDTQSFPFYFANYTVNSYGKRMQIEESFRDQKAARFGFAGNVQACKISARLGTLILISTLAHVAALLLGMIVESSGKSRYYQANTVKRRRVISLSFLGFRAFCETGFHFVKSVWQVSPICLRGMLTESNYYENTT